MVVGWFVVATATLVVAAIAAVSHRPAVVAKGGAYIYRPGRAVEMRNNTERMVIRSGVAVGATGGSPGPGLLLASLSWCCPSQPESSSTPVGLDWLSRPCAIASSSMRISCGNCACLSAAIAVERQWRGGVADNLVSGPCEAQVVGRIVGPSRGRRVISCHGTQFRCNKASLDDGTCM